MSSWLSVCVILSLAAASSAIVCWKCGSYSEGVGSITPCNNQTVARLENCPHSNKYCIKYVSELTIVRDCVPTCSEKDWWGARTYCCDTDECNSGPREGAAIAVVLAAIFTTLATR